MRGSWNGAQLIGAYVKKRGNQTTTLPFRASPTESEVKGVTLLVPVGKYQVLFAQQDRSGTAVAATLWMNGDELNGTFIAPDGDYGLLVGKPSNEGVQLSRFTGWQAIAMTFEQNGGKWSGNYYFQNDKPRAFVLEPREDLALTPPPPLQTSMKDPNATFTFEGLSISGETVRSSDDRFKGKPMVVDIMGTWCHNCIDGAPLLEQLQEKYGKNGLSVVGISFELADDDELGRKNLKLYKDRLGLSYTLLFCGSLDDANVNTRLRSQIQNFFAYPTTLFIDRNGKVKALNSGFKGPGTGEEYQAQVREFHALAAGLVK
jgi:thiol-disulfide isomerase/thioredoxin